MLAAPRGSITTERQVKKYGQLHRSIDRNADEPQSGQRQEKLTCFRPSNGSRGARMRPGENTTGNINDPQVTSVLAYLVSRIAPRSGWKERLVYLWEIKHPQIPMAQMGFPENWKESPIWKD
jgi:hypothetical protein